MDYCDQWCEFDEEVAGMMAYEEEQRQKRLNRKPRHYSGPERDFAYYVWNILLLIVLSLSCGAFLIILGELFL